MALYFIRGDEIHEFVPEKFENVFLMRERMNFQIRNLDKSGRDIYSKIHVNKLYNKYTYNPSIEEEYERSYCDTTRLSKLNDDYPFELIDVTKQELGEDMLIISRPDFGPFEDYRLSVIVKDGKNYEQIRYSDFVPDYKNVVIDHKSISFTDITPRIHKNIVIDFCLPFLRYMNSFFVGIKNSANKDTVIKIIDHEFSEELEPYFNKLYLDKFHGFEDGVFMPKFPSMKEMIAKIEKWEFILLRSSQDIFESKFELEFALPNFTPANLKNEGKHDMELLFKFVDAEGVSSSEKLIEVKFSKNKNFDDKTALLFDRAKGMISKSDHKIIKITVPDYRKTRRFHFLNEKMKKLIFSLPEKQFFIEWK